MILHVTYAVYIFLLLTIIEQTDLILEIYPGLLQKSEKECFATHCVKIVQSVSIRIQSECGKIRTRKSSVFGHFSRSDKLPISDVCVSLDTNCSESNQLTKIKPANGT